jgi:hypothetical protein
MALSHKLFFLGPVPLECKLGGLENVLKVVFMKIILVHFLSGPKRITHAWPISTQSIDYCDCYWRRVFIFIQPWINPMNAFLSLLILVYTSINQEVGLFTLELKKTKVLIPLMLHGTLKNHISKKLKSF